MREPIPFGRYLLLERVGLGGMAEVWAARDREAAPGEGLVAVKRLLPHLAEEPDQVERFRREAWLGARLHHTGLVAVRAHGRIRASWYQALEWVPGVDLGAVRSALDAWGARVPPGLAALLCQRVAEALDYLHAARAEDGAAPGLVHRDVAPRNVLLSFAGAVKLCDLGIAAPAGASGRGAPRGRRSCRPPEAATGAPASPQGDLFAVGALLRDLLRGEREVPPALHRAMAWALAPDPAARPSSGRALAEVLRPLAEGEVERLAGWLRGLFPEEARREEDRERRVA